MSLLVFLPLLLYIACVAAVTFSTRSSSEDSEYFFGGRRLNAVQAFISVMSSETSVATTVVFPAAGLAGGYTLLWLIAGYILGRCIVATFYLRKLYESSRLTIYQTMSANHGVLEGAYLCAKYISSGVRFFMGGFALQQLLGGSTTLWVIVIGICAATYSLTGGLRAVVIMDQLQGALIVGTGIFLCWLLYARIPEGAAFAPAFWNGDPRVYQFSPGLLLGGAVLSIGTHGADQDMILRVLGTKNLREARKSLILSGFGAAVLITLYLTVGYLLGLVGAEGLNPKSPLADFVSQSNLPLLQGLFLVLLVAAAMSSLDSTLHSTGAVWKSLMHSTLPGRVWSFWSLLLLIGAAMIFQVVAARHNDFLALAMGSMNYINGGLIGIFTTFTFFPHRMSRLGVPLALAAGFAVTTTCEWAFTPPVPWTYTIVLSSAAAFLACFICKPRPA